MIPAVIHFVSPKGYGIARTGNDELIFVPANLMEGYLPDESVQIEVEPGELRPHLRAVSMNKGLQAGTPQRISGDIAGSGQPHP